LRTITLLVAGFRDVLKDYGIDVVGGLQPGRADRPLLEVKPDVLVIDVRFDSKGCGENGLDVCEELLARDPSAKIIVFSQFDDQYIIERSYKLGVLAFVRKDESTEVLNEAINTVAQGKNTFPEIARLLAWSAVKDQTRTGCWMRTKCGPSACSRWRIHDRNCHRDGLVHQDHWPLDEGRKSQARRRKLPTSPSWRSVTALRQLP
jgi:DNA-binding response OmpR family regulator